MPEGKNKSGRRVQLMPAGGKVFRKTELTDATKEWQQEDQFHKLSYNRAVKLAKGGNVVSFLFVPRVAKHKVDAYMDATAYPTFTGMALALGFSGVKHWEAEMEKHALDIAKTGDPVKQERLYVWELARSRVQLHYEEGIQASKIPAAVGKFVLEVLGFQPVAQVEQRVAGAQAAAEAARTGYAQAARDLAKAGVQGASLAADAASKLQ